MTPKKNPDLKVLNNTNKKQFFIIYSFKKDKSTKNVSFSLLKLIKRR